ncbi:DNA polymerase beta superfamily protein [Streptomyces sp. NPDC006285]|uniref:nucleotidyltransferase domain-containing protein n=1 Tax=Streptomyces sp. NPDC006285 TaxID=3364742 RepID=UPI0036AE11F7
MTTRNILLSGIVGSTAYGLARPGSDVDRLGMFAAPTEDLHGLHGPKESHVTTGPDSTLHEAAKWCRLALRGNPTVVELVWLPHELYEVRTPLGDELIGIRTALLCAKRVRDAYLGYATQQFKRLYDRRAASTDSADPTDTRRRTAKHARHLKRLCHQGFELYATGSLSVRVEDPDEYHRFGEQVAADAMAALPLLQHYEAAFDGTRSALPDRPDEAPVEAWLRKVRAHHYTPVPVGPAVRSR